LTVSGRTGELPAEHVGLVQVNLSSKFVDINGHTFLRFKEASPTVIDCGANQGSFSSQLLEQWPTASIHAVEPTPGLHGTLSRIPLARLHRAALSDSVGEVVLHLNENSEASSIEGSIDGDQGGVRVPSVTLPMLIESTGRSRIDLLKLDVEGAEIQAMKATSDSFLERIDQLSIEFHEFMFPSHRPEIAALSERLSRLGFTRVNFSWPHTSNVLFFRRRHLDVGALVAPIATAKRAYWYTMRRPR
jgi:FkbM family methyltransferase